MNNVSTSIHTEDEFFEELDRRVHSGDYKISPAAGAWLRTYRIFPNEVLATGPKGYMTKYDVMNHAIKHNLKEGERPGVVRAK